MCHWAFVLLASEIVCDIKRKELYKCRAAYDSVALRKALCMHVYDRRTLAVQTESPRFDAASIASVKRDVSADTENVAEDDERSSSAYL